MHDLEELGPSVIVGAGAYNMFILIGHSAIAKTKII
jgi:hypothetical protein